MRSDIYSRVPELYIIRNEALTGIRYRDGINYPIVKPFVRAMVTQFVLMDDNARSHRANIVNRTLRHSLLREWNDHRCHQTTIRLNISGML